MPMLTDELLKKLDGISDGSVKGYPVKNLYRLMYTPELWMVAYSNLQSNKGAMTKGVNEDTLDGFSKARVDGIIQKLREGTYEPNPVRRTSIPKSNGNSRPLGIPRGTDKLVQEVARIILERIYEPVFSDFSHGFRPKRSCHTVSDCVKNTWNGTKWICDVDITGFFDNSTVVYCHFWRQCDTLRPYPILWMQGQTAHATSHHSARSHRDRPCGHLSRSL